MRGALLAGVWLSEAAALLARNTEYEIPYFKKAAAKAGAQLLDLERRGADYQRSTAAAAVEYRQVQRLPSGLGLCQGGITWRRRFPSSVARDGSCLRVKGLGVREAKERLLRLARQIEVPGDTQETEGLELTGGEVSEPWWHWRARFLGPSSIVGFERRI